MDDAQKNPLAPVIIGIAGGSGSGKTTVAFRVREACPDKTIQIIHHDAYYHDNSHLTLEQRAQINYDHPKAFETELLVEHLRELRAGRPVEIPQYDYSTHSRRTETVTCQPADIIFVEGILVLEAKILRRMMDIRLFVDVDADERVLRRMKRDINERGRTMDSVIEQYLQVVRPMHLQFVWPSKRYAHLIIPEGGHNLVAIDLIATKISDIIRERDRLRALDIEIQKLKSENKKAQ
ncbi:uridine kinase [bacterium DOLJORAL78_65_58]|nr:MAG: uridine kinase [bacterium DOLZORAL124_64_63]PIE76756.1 MAG: uridine kinase [bacterium DOLJORAL78_65_58]